MKFDSCHTADFKPVKQEVNSTVILHPLVFLAYNILRSVYCKHLNDGCDELRSIIKCHITMVFYKKRCVSRINPFLLLKINLYNTWTLQLTRFNQMENHIQKIIKGPA
jgi:hypothetical protein